MQTLQINRTVTGLFSLQQLDLSYNQNRFIPYLNHAFSLEAFEDIIEEKAREFTFEKRKVLVEAIEKQYCVDFNSASASNVFQNIQLLKENSTFTVTTGHQLSVFTGPLYFIYKILHVVKQCEELKIAYPNQNFVPVYWMASEDHDYEEIKSFFIFNQTISWETSQKGPVGRYSMDEFETVKLKMHELFHNHPDAEIHSLIDALNGENYAQAFHHFIHSLFKEFGVVIVDGDDRQLKQLFAPIIKDELTHQFSIQAVEKTNEELVKEGAKIQVTPREINLFYIENGFRERIQKFGDKFEIEGKGTFSLNELLELLEKSPEKFSPNVVLRPVYQEVILPNLCYVGGAGEISYWLQLKRVFDAVNVIFPLIQVRNSVCWIDANTSEKISKLSLLIDDVFMDADVLKKRFVEANSQDELDFTQLNNQLLVLKETLIKTVQSVDENLEGYAIAETVRLDKQLDSLKEKLYRQSKSKHEKALKNIDQIKERLFPNGGLQERVLNFFHLCPDGNYSEKLNFIKNNLQPFSGDFIVFRENE